MPGRWSLRVLGVAVVLAAFTILVFAGWRAALDRYAGAWTHQPEDAAWVLPDTAQTLVEQSFADLDGAVVDQHVDLITDGQLASAAVGGGAQADVRASPSGSPIAWARRRAVRHAAGMGDGVFADAEYMSRLLRQMAAMPGEYRARLFARDAVYDDQGRLAAAATTDFVANAVVVWLAERAPDRLVPVVSVHPARDDAVQALAHWAERGVKHVSWLPVAQRIDLDGAAANAAYAAMAEHGMTLHTRVGRWKSADGHEDTIDPAALKPALDAGLEVSVAIGDVDAGADIDVMASLFSLLRQPAYNARLRIDLGGVLEAGRLADVLTPLLQHPQFFDRMRYASAYPDPALARAIDPARLADHDFLDPALVEPLRAIYDVNPLLFALVTLRHVRLPTTGLHFPASVFTQESGS